MSGASFAAPFAQGTSFSFKLSDDSIRSGQNYYRTAEKKHSKRWWGSESFQSIIKIQIIGFLAIRSV